jgi:hypothetical protein
MSVGSEKNSMLVIDDCIDTTEFWDNKTIEEILMNGRHYKIPYIISMETPTNIPHEFIINFDHIFLMDDESEYNRKRLFNNYGSFFPSRFAFEKIFMECTKDNRAMIICNKNEFEGLNKMVYWFEPKCVCDEIEYTPLIDLDNKENQYVPAVLDFIAPESSELVAVDRTYDENTCNDNAITYEENASIYDENAQAVESIPITNKTTLTLGYSDENCNFLFTTNDVLDSDAIMVLCDHVVTLKNQRLEHMRLINENMKLQLELKKYKYDQ